MYDTCYTRNTTVTSDLAIVFNRYNYYAIGMIQFNK